MHSGGTGTDAEAMIGTQPLLRRPGDVPDYGRSARCDRAGDVDADFHDQSAGPALFSVACVPQPALSDQPVHGDCQGLPEWECWCVG